LCFVYVRDYEQRSHKNLKQAVLAVDSALYKQLALQRKRMSRGVESKQAREGCDAKRPNAAIFTL
jgi:hypothetical protein